MSKILHSLLVDDTDCWTLPCPSCEVFYVCSEWSSSTFLILNGWHLFVCQWETFFRPQALGEAKFIRGIFQTMKTGSWGSSNFPVPQQGQSWSLSKQPLRVSIMRWNSSFPQQSPLTSPPSPVRFLTWASWDHVLYRLLLDQVFNQLSGDLET